MGSNRWARLDQKVVFFVCAAFFDGKNAPWISRHVHKDLGQIIHRTQVYKVVAEGLRRGYFQLTPPRDMLLSARMLDRFVHSRRARGAAREKVVNVVTQGYERSLEHIAVAAAHTALDVIREIDERTRRGTASGEEPPPVHVGFGAGATTMLVARHLAERLRTDERPPRLVLHALTSGFDVAGPATAPVAFFNFFHGIPGVSYRGLFAAAYARSKDWKRTREHVGVRESFAARSKLQVVITSLASREDPHGELNRFMEVNAELGKKARQVLDVEEGRVGDVIYRPFNAKGPITKSAGIRAVTLFELEDLRKFAAKDGNAVILVAGPCGASDCRRSRSDALLPLLVVPKLDVWTHLVTDDITASACLEA
jgi:hypothetical protein